MLSVSFTSLSIPLAVCVRVCLWVSVYAEETACVLISVCSSYPSGALHRFCLQASDLFFSALTEVDIWTKREAERDGEGGGVQISSCAFIQACGLITLYLNLIPCCERDTLASSWSIMHFSVSPFNLHAGLTRWHYHLPRKVQETPDI